MSYDDRRFEALDMPVPSLSARAESAVSRACINFVPYITWLCEMGISVVVAHRGVVYPIQLPLPATLADLHAQLQQVTSVPESNQKLIYKGKRTLADADLKDGIKLQMLGSTSEQINAVNAADDEREKGDRIMRDRASKPQVKLRTTASLPSSKYIFHRVASLPHLPNPSSAHKVLDKLAHDPAILHIMAQHQFSVALLTELAPHEYPQLLGLNINAGQEIKLRIRTDLCDGFRHYPDVRRVLCHELAHNVWGQHDNNFKELNSKLNRELVHFERAKAAGTYHLSEQDIYQPPSSGVEAETQTYVLGGPSAAPLEGDSRQEMRRRILEATINRLKKEEEELEMSCGTGSDACRAE